MSGRNRNSYRGCASTDIERASANLFARYDTVPPAASAQVFEFLTLWQRVGFVLGTVMHWPPDNVCERIAALWSVATGAGASVNERNTALTMLARLQAEHKLSDVELAFIAESLNHPQAEAEEPNLLDTILELFTRYHIKMPLVEQIVVALWVLHTHVYKQFLHTPRLLIYSADAGSGKTTLMMLQEQLVSQPFYSADASTAVIRDQLFDESETTFLLDEGEHLAALWGRDRSFKSLFDQGHRRGGVSHRMVGGRRTSFPCFCPWAIAMRVDPHRLPRQMLSRSILVEMVKNNEGKDIIRADELWLTAGRNIISTWAQTFRAPDEVKDLPPGREAGDNWRVLITIADELGYGTTARAALKTKVHSQDDPVVVLLHDIRRIFLRDNFHSVFTRELLVALHELQDSFWDEFPGIGGNEKLHRLNRDELYKLLAFKRIYRTNVRQGDKFAKGFYRSQFEAVWHQLFGDTLTQSKIIRLPRHRTGTGTAQEEEE